mgnify:CR=1 FL=1
MSFEERQDFARQVADLNKYGQALNQCETADEVVSLTLEAITLLFDLSDVTVVEVRDDLRVVGSTNPALGEGSEPGPVAREACETGETVVETGSRAGIRDDSDVSATLAVPEGIVDETIAVIVVRSTTAEEFGEETVRPMEILASHAATAISNIRSRERLERARQNLETRKEMVEMYDRLLRHDIGNDLQVIAGYAEAVNARVEDDRTCEYVGKIERAARSSADLIDRVGDLVSTLETQREPEPRDLRPLLAGTVDDLAHQYESLSVECEPDDFEYRVYAGDLLDSVFTNVLSNAAVHNEGPVTVSLSAEEPTPDTVVVGMADDGAGVPPEIRDDIFEMGVSGPDSDGTGFGLGFVRALTESYGGTVDVRESDAGGAEFRVTLERT